MMRLASLEVVNKAAKDRERLLQMRAHVEADRLQVVIHSVYQDDAMVALVRPMIVGEINARLHRIEAALKGLGVEL